jgi:hypothetical protein
MAVSFTEYNYNRKVSVKVDTTTHLICADTFRVIVRPILNGQPSVVDLIDGSRLSRFPSPRFHIDLELNWDHTSQQQYLTEIIPLTADLIAHAATANAKKFYPFQPYVDGDAIDFVPEITEELYAFAYNRGSRNRGLKMVLRSENVITVIPDWLKEDTT